MGDQGTGDFMSLLVDGQNLSLRHLYLNANGIGENASRSIGNYLASPNCSFTSLFLSTNPIGDAGMLHIAKGLYTNKSLERLTLASTGLTSAGIVTLATALTKEHSIKTLDLSASQTTAAHSQRFNYINDACIEALKDIIALPSLRFLDLGRTVLSSQGIQEVNQAVATSQLVYFSVNHVEVITKPNLFNTNAESQPIQGTVHDAVPANRSCSLAVHRRLVENRQKYYPNITDYDSFQHSEELRFLRNTSDVRKIDSMYRTRDKRLGLPMDQAWEEGDETWKLVVEDEEKWLRST
jgi:hypothetical protein